MAASLLQVLVLFPNIEFPNSPTIIFLLLLVGVPPIKYFLSRIVFEFQTTVRAQQIVQLLLLEQGQQETAEYMDHITKL